MLGKTIGESIGLIRFELSQDVAPVNASEADDAERVLFVVATRDEDAVAAQWV